MDTNMVGLEADMAPLLLRTRAGLRDWNIY